MAFNAPVCARTYVFLHYLLGFALVGVLALQVSCSGSGDPLVPPAASTVQAVTYGTDSVRIAATAGSADPGTTAVAATGATGSGMVAADGSFSFDAVLAAGASQVIVAYTHDGFDLTTTCTAGPLADCVTKSLFATGAGPNDMVYGDESLYIANSMDNTVVRYGLDGTELATASFDAGASPSYLGLDDSVLWVVCNGDNRIAGLARNTLTRLTSNGSFQLTATGAAFLGPGEPVSLDGQLYIPCNNIASFSPTTYGTGLVNIINTSSADQGELATLGVNPQFASYDASRDSLYITTSGNIQFDEFFTPYAESDSYFENIWTAGDAGNPQQVNLGRIGAGRIALSPDGSAAIVGSSLAANLYTIDLETFNATHGADNPIVLTEGFSYSSDIAFTPDGRYVLALSFNTDELFVLDAATWELNAGPYPEAFDLALSEELLAGVVNIEIAPDPDRSGRYAAYVLYGVGNAVAKVELF